MSHTKRLMFAWKEESGGDTDSYWAVGHDPDSMPASFFYYRDDEEEKKQEANALFMAGSWNSFFTSATTLGIPAKELATALDHGGIARLVEALERFVCTSGLCHCDPEAKKQGIECVICEGKAALAGLPKREGVGNG